MKTTPSLQVAAADMSLSLCRFFAGTGCCWSTGTEPGLHPRRAGRQPPGTGEVMPASRRPSAGGDPAGHRPSQDPGQHLLGRVRERFLLGGQVGLPGRGVPDLHPGVGPDDHAVPVQARVLAQPRGHGDPALLVGDLVRGAGEQHPAVVPLGLALHLRVPHGRGDPGELGERPHVQAAFLAFRDHHPLRELVPVLGRQDQPPLLIQPGSVRAEEHRTHLPGLRAALPNRPTALHCTPHSPTVNAETAVFRGSRPTKGQLRASGAKWGGNGGPGRPMAQERKWAAVSSPGGGPAPPPPPETSRSGRWSVSSAAADVLGAWTRRVGNREASRHGWARTYCRYTAVTVVWHTTTGDQRGAGPVGPARPMRRPCWWWIRGATRAELSTIWSRWPGASARPSNR